jgi:ribonuclease VapC
MFIDAAAFIAILSEENEGARCSNALLLAERPFTSAIAVWEAIVTLSKPKKLGNQRIAETAVSTFIEARAIEVRQLPPPDEAMQLSLAALRQYRTGRHRLNLADCFHYACARHYGAAMLSTADEFRFTDLETVP